MHVEMACRRGCWEQRRRIVLSRPMDHSWRCTFGSVAVELRREDKPRRRELFAQHARPWLLWTAAFPVAAGLIAGGIGRAIGDSDQSLLKASFGNGELLMGNVVLLGATLDVCTRNAKRRDLNLFIGLVTLLAVIGMWIARVANGEPASHASILLSMVVYAALAGWAVFELLALMSDTKPARAVTERRQVLENGDEVTLRIEHAKSTHVG